MRTDKEKMEDFIVEDDAENSLGEYWASAAAATLEDAGRDDDWEDFLEWIRCHGSAEISKMADTAEVYAAAAEVVEVYLANT
ncbi:MAG: hypothetical protein UY96_C0039G0002 [Parcubacteria group bacterium GW2011_GWB1_56_8]|nr:MAG: hypothetical protein UY96_C0039G0002 [Parcubacteria group bacterium GW2011_GWB1_56_8]